MPDLDTLAHHPDPYPLYESLRRRGVHQLDNGRWVAPTAAAVTAVLSSPAALVRESPPPDPVQARMSRFSDGPAHSRRRGLALAALAGNDPAALRRRAEALTSARIAGRDEFDAMAELARTIPVAALAESLGIPPDALDSVAPDDESAVNVAALLFQTRDATAGLIGSSWLFLASSLGSGGETMLRRGWWPSSLWWRGDRGRGRTLEAIGAGGRPVLPLVTALSRSWRGDARR